MKSNKQNIGTKITLFALWSLPDSPGIDLSMEFSDDQNYKRVG